MRYCYGQFVRPTSRHYLLSHLWWSACDKDGYCRSGSFPRATLRGNRTLAVINANLKGVFWVNVCMWLLIDFISHDFSFKLFWTVALWCTCRTFSYRIGEELFISNYFIKLLLWSSLIFYKRRNPNFLQSSRHVTSGLTTWGQIRTFMNAWRRDHSNSPFNIRPMCGPHGYPTNFANSTLGRIFFTSKRKWAKLETMFVDGRNFYSWAYMEGIKYRIYWMPE